MFPISECNYESNEYLHVNLCGVQHVNYHAWSLRENGRVDYHIIYIYEGCLLAEICGKEKLITEGNLILYRPNERQKYTFLENHPTIQCYLHFSGTACDDLMNKIGFTESPVIYIGKSKQLVEIFEKMETELRFKKENYDFFCHAHLMEFFAAVMRKRYYQNNPSDLKNTVFIESVCSLMHENYNRQLPIKYYADYCNLSISRFSHIFKEALNLSPLEYINKIKISRAINLLTSTDLNISEIAEKSGFSNQNYFSRFFKAYTGISPKKYRDKSM